MPYFPHFRRSLPLMDRLHYGQNFEKNLNMKTNYHSIEEHPKISLDCKFCIFLYYARKIDTNIEKTVSIFSA